MNTRTETHPKVKALREQLAEHDIYAMYGCKKGHGFWLYRTNAGIAKQLCENFDPALWHDNVVYTLHNDGVKSGNDCFWMFEDAEKLVASTIIRRTFEAWKYAKGSKERANLNSDVVTSEYMKSYKYVLRCPAFLSDGTPNPAQKYHDRTFTNKGDAVRYAEEHGYTRGE